VAHLLYILVELLVAARATAYSLVDDTISDLGAHPCPPLGLAAVKATDAAEAAMCSAAPALMNTAFVVFGALLAAGAVLLVPSFPRGRLPAAALLLWVVAGVSGVGTGLAPVDTHPALHGWVSSPAFVAQPLALLVMGWVLGRGHRQHRWLAGSALVVGVVSGAGAAAFGVLLGEPYATGLVERLALWPGYLWAGALGVVVLRGQLTGPNPP